MRNEAVVTLRHLDDLNGQNGFKIPPSVIAQQRSLTTKEFLKSPQSPKYLERLKYYVPYLIDKGQTKDIDLIYSSALKSARADKLLFPPGFIQQCEADMREWKLEIAKMRRK